MTLPQTSLYTYFDACGTILYVGITDHGPQRQKQHALTQAWWPLVRYSRVIHYPSREEARTAELEAIRRWHPPFNRGDNPDAWSSMIRYFLDRMPAEDNDHEHDTGESYTRCSNCLRCAPVYEDNPHGFPPYCQRCDDLRTNSYSAGMRGARQQVLTLAGTRGVDLTDFLRDSANEAPF